jgi:hypothetical protein
MNANELNRWIENSPYTEQEEVIVLLRQQAAEIEKLMSLVDIQKAVSRDVDIDFLNETINQQAAEIEAGIELVRKLQEEREALKKENAFIKNNLCTPLLGPMFHGDTYEDGKVLQTKTLTDEEFDNIFANGKRLGVLETEDRFRKALNLTDEEIKETLKIYYPRNADNHINDLVWFARAVLKKASEK